MIKLFNTIYLCKGATSWEFQIAALHGGINFPSFWRGSGLFYFGWDKTWNSKADR